MSNFAEEAEPFCSVDGVGSIECEGQLFAGITYMIECWQKAQGTCAISGLIDTDWKSATKIRRARDSVLILETGQEIAIAIVGRQAGALEIEVHTPIKSCVLHGDLRQIAGAR